MLPLGCGGDKGNRSGKTSRCVLAESFVFLGSYPECGRILSIIIIVRLVNTPGQRAKSGQHATMCIRTTFPPTALCRSFEIPWTAALSNRTCI